MTKIGDQLIHEGHTLIAKARADHHGRPLSIHICPIGGVPCFFDGKCEQHSTCYGENDQALMWVLVKVSPNGGDI